MHVLKHKAVTKLLHVEAYEELGIYVIDNLCSSQ